MPSASKLEWPQGEPLFETQWRAVAESLAGNGVKDAADFELTPGANAREIDHATGTAFYIASEYSTGSGTLTVSAGDPDNDRWDTVYLDTSVPELAVREGTPAANPEPLDLSGEELLLGIVKVPQNFDDVFASSQILNWRAQYSNEAGEVHYPDSTGTYGLDNVEAALDELEEAAQITAYPLSIATDTEASQYPLANSDLSNSTIDVNAGTALETTNASIGLGGSATVSVTDGAIDLTQLGNPFALQDITDGDLSTEDLTAESGAFKVFDNTEDHVPRAQVDDRKAVTTVTSSSYTTSDEEVVLVDTETIAAASTVTLASADCMEGNTIRVSDLTGSARDYPITVDTEDTETIDGQDTFTIDTGYNAIALVCDGNGNWKITASLTAGGRGAPQYDFSGAETGAVTNGNQGQLVVSNLADGETAELYRAVLTLDTVEAAPTDVDLILATYDNAGGFTPQDTLISGDGSTIYDSVTGTPLASYTNTSGGEESVGVLVDNQSGGDVDIIADVEGRTGL